MSNGGKMALPGPSLKWFVNVFTSSGPSGSAHSGEIPTLRRRAHCREAPDRHPIWPVAGLPLSPSLDPNFDGDGLLQDYAFGREPDATDTPPVISYFTQTNGIVGFDFPINPLAIDLHLTAWFGESPDAFLKTAEWNPMGDSISGGPPGSVIEEEGKTSIKIGSEPGDEPRKFGRISVELK
jgi:hypothetical protein